MDCSDAEERLVPYLQDALNCDEATVLERHISACADCSRRLAAEMIDDLARALPQKEPPQSVRDGLMARIDSAGIAKRAWACARTWAANMARAISWRGALGLGGSAAAMLIVLLLAGLWFNDRLGQVSRDAAQLSDELALARERESEVMSAVKERHQATYELIRMSSTAGVSVNHLMGTGPWSSSSGVIMVSHASNRGLLLVENMPSLPFDRIYQAWLTRDGVMYRAGWFTVDALGYGQMAIASAAPLRQFDGIIVTIEPRAGDAAPTGVSVLKGDF